MPTQLKPKINVKFCAGFTLLEILFAAIIGLILIASLIQNYLSAKNIYHKQIKISRLSENLRFANFFLQQNIMHAGFTGCRKISELDLTNHTNISFEFANSIYGYASNNLPRYLSNKVASGTDVIVIKKATADITAITATSKKENTSIKVLQNPATEANQFLLISDCKNADLFIAENWTGNTITMRNKLNHDYQINNTQVSRFEEITFFISKTKRTTAKNEPIYSLYFSVNQNKKQELISEIISMKIVYGIDAQNQGKVTEYLAATEITNKNLWDRVLSVVITLKPQNGLKLPDQWKIYINLRERN
jgi:Tfp pilus assembly protein PilW